MPARARAEEQGSTSPPDTVDAYIAAAPPEAIERLGQVRGTMRQAAPGAEECISYRIPSFKQEGPLAYFASFAAHIGVYPVTAGIHRWMAAEVEKYGAGKGTLRFPFSEPLPLDVIARFVRIRLAENLGLDEADPDRDIISTRWLDAPRDSVFRAFTDEEIVARWWGPVGFTNRFIDFDPRPEGLWNFVMEGPDGSRYELSKRFLEVEPDERVVVEHLDPTHHFVHTSTFAKERRGTRLTWSIRFADPAQAAAVRVPFAAANEENFDRLQTILATAPGGASRAGNPRARRQ